MHASKLKENYQPNLSQEKPLTRDFDPREHEEKDMESRLKELVYFTSMAIFSIVFVILNYLLLMMLPVFLTVPLAFGASFFLVLLAKKFLQKNKKFKGLI
ncbi:DUF3270 family protein [Streptococcaceae bacterium ESL0687]|nr:DUF3270 family protein [Streptococcaceae bacterium ESL0687]